MIHELPVRVYYEDTDFGGIVYYANYLKFIERGRSEWVREIGIDQIALKAEGTVFAVRRVEADYLAPAKFDDQLIVRTEVIKVGGASVTFLQKVIRDDMILFEATVVVVSMGANDRPVRLPANFRPE
ncbi:MAG: tol-pal system-associated acyl-CoA thioesterase [Yoonia sp.]